MKNITADVQFPWMEWEAEELLGEGSFGSVYKARRQEFNHTFYSAIKVIRIPQNQSEIRRAKSQGMDADTMKKYFGGFLSSLIDEIVMMDTLKYVKNVVRIEDYKAVEDEDGIGWTVYIRMELLCPFDEYLAEHQMTEDEVVQLGMDICSALEGCEKAGVIHRDIKPENLFMSQMGEYKLGDFGIARQLEKTTGGLSKKGTFHYMAPEVYKGEPYGKTVDIYSLGIVMYQLLNHNRIPFMPPYPEVVTFSDNEKALSLRMAGEALERPIMAEGRLADIVLKACAYRSGDRYQSAGELKKALQEYALSQEKNEDELPAHESILTENASLSENALADEMDSHIKEPTQKVKNLYEGTISLWGEEVQEVKEENTNENNRFNADKIIETFDDVKMAEDKKIDAEPAESKNPMGKEEQVYEKVVRKPLFIPIKQKQCIISAGAFHTVGLKRDGSVVLAGDFLFLSDWLFTKMWEDIVSVSSGSEYVIGLKKDGTVVLSGLTNDYDRVIQSWSNIVDVSAGGKHIVGIKSDGTAVSAGKNVDGCCDVVAKRPADRWLLNPAGRWTHIVSVSAGEKHTVGLKQDGKVIAVGNNVYGQCNVGTWHNIIEISAGAYHTIALSEYGTVVATGNRAYGRCDVAGWKDIIAVSAGAYHTVGLRADGTVVATGANSYNQCDVGNWEHIVAISAGTTHTVGVREDGTVVAVGQKSQCNVGDWKLWDE